MLTSLIAAMAAQPAEAQAVPVPPVPAAYVIHGDYAAPGTRGHFGRLIDQWSAEGLIRNRPSERAEPDISGCFVERPYERIDADCVRSRYPAQAGAPPAVVIVATHTRRVVPEFRVTCVGPAGYGAAIVNVNRGGAFAPDAGEQSAVRKKMADCIAGALPGAIARRDAATRGFDFWGTGGGDLFYNRLTADCAQVQHRIGRNATRGRFAMPLLGVRWSLETEAGKLPRVRFDCVEGDCIEAQIPGATRQAAVHRIAFADAARVRSFLARLDAVQGACRR